MNLSCKLPALICVLCLSACAGDVDPGKSKATVVYDLDEGAQGWQPGFADYPEAADPAFYELESRWTVLPAPLDSMHGIFISGSNHSDDLMMYIKRRLTGLKPNTRYALTFGVEFATNADTGCAGAGGAPGEGVTVKAGANKEEPTTETDDHGVLRLNIDHGDQNSGGSDAIVIGDIAGMHTDCTDDVYELKTLDSEGFSFEAYTGDSGELWAIFATDSGYEGRTGIYFTRLEIRAEER
jgi:hypothetical protein